MKFQSLFFVCKTHFLIRKMNDKPTAYGNCNGKRAYKVRLRDILINTQTYEKSIKLGLDSIGRNT